MTRQKKSRKPGTLGAKSTPKNLRQRPATDGGQTQQKRKGKPPGNRHSIETQTKARSQGSQQPTDPRVGSKRKVPLSMPSTDKDVQRHAPRPDTDQAIRNDAAPNPAAVDASSTVVDDSIKLAEDEFARLENDPRLQDLLAQLDAGDTIAAEDQAWVDAQLDRYQQLADQLGVDIDADADADGIDEDDDELEPWKKFENPKDWM